METDIPDLLRTRFHFHYRAIDPLMFVDELYGRRLVFSQPVGTLTSGLLAGVLSIDDVDVAADLPPATPTPIDPFSQVNHPYAANSGTYADETLNWLGGIARSRKPSCSPSAIPEKGMHVTLRIASMRPFRRLTSTSLRASRSRRSSPRATRCSHRSSCTRSRLPCDSRKAPLVHGSRSITPWDSWATGA